MKRWVLLVFGVCIAASSIAQNIVLEHEHFRYVIAADGRNLAFINKADGVDYLVRETPSYCASVSDANGTYLPVSVSFWDQLLTVKFANENVLELKVEKVNKAFRLEVVRLTGNPVSVNFLNIPLTLSGIQSDPIGACGLALNLQVNVREYPVLQRHISAEAFAKFGFTGAKAALMAMPPKELLAGIREIVAEELEFPHSEVGGAWALSSPQNYGSYLMNFGNLTEETVDQWISYCKQVGANEIDHHGGDSSFFRFGDFQLNPEKWPGGWQQFKTVNKSLKQAGIASIFHTYAFFIDKTSTDISPVPSRDLDYFSEFTLAKPISATDTLIEVMEPTADISLFTGFHYRNSVTLRIGDELITFSGVTREPPYRFTGCIRGVNGTSASAHAEHQSAYHLKELFGRFVPRAKSDLFFEMAKRTADIVNGCGFDAIYFDAIDGSDIFEGPTYAWHYASRFVSEVARYLERPIGMEMSLMTHHFWHYRTRWQAWDVSRRGHKRFIDYHIKNINKGLMLPLNLGWWLNFTWDPPQTEYTFTDDVEYLGAKMIGYDAGLSLLGGYEEHEVAANPSFVVLNKLIRQYEELRQSQYFNEKVKARLRVLGDEFTLVKADDDRWGFKPVTYHKEIVTEADTGSFTWSFYNAYEKQPIKIRIQALTSVRPYDDPEGITIADGSQVNLFSAPVAATGVTGGIRDVLTDRIPGEKGIQIFSRSTGEVTEKAAWLSTRKTFAVPMDLGQNKGLGVWVKGDGSGHLLNIKLTSPMHLSTGARGDRFVRIDFTGWKYVELVEHESYRIAEYGWPDYHPYNDMYRAHLFQVSYDQISEVELLHNDLPIGDSVVTEISPIRALPMVTGTFSYPSLTIGDQTITFPVHLESGMFLEFKGMDDCVLYGSKGEMIQRVIPTGTIPTAVSGENAVAMGGSGQSGINSRLEVTVITEGETFFNQ